MANRTQSKSQNRGESSSAFSWSGGTGSLLGAAVAGAGIAVAAHFGRKLFRQGMEARAGDWDDMFRQDHAEILKTFDEMLATDSTQSFKRNTLLFKLVHKLDKHAYEEEAVVYPALREDNDRKQADDLDTEHGHIKTFIYELKQMKTDSPDWLEKVRQFRDLVAEHARMEEEEVFPRLKKDLDSEKNAKINRMVNKAGFMMA